jgi:hypothetical protein
MSRRLFPFSFVAGLLGALAFAVPASADAGACVVNGTATTNPPVLLSGGASTYSFASGQGTPTLHLVCAGVDSANNVGVSDINTPSNGSYSNTVCGTGILTSTPGQTGPGAATTLAGSPGPGNDFAAKLPTASYVIKLIAGLGTFEWGAGSSIHSVVAGLPADGVITFGANFDANQQAGQCTRHFTLTGVITGSF